MRKELWFGFSLMAILIAGSIFMLATAQTITNGHLGLLMLGLVVVAIMLGFPTAFTLMGMGMMFGWFAYRSVNPRSRDAPDSRFDGSAHVLGDVERCVDRNSVVRVHGLPGRARQPDRKAVSQPASGDGTYPASLAVATIVTCAVFATATGIVGAVVTLMGLLAFPAMLKAGYNIQVGAGSLPRVDALEFLSRRRCC